MLAAAGPGPTAKARVRGGMDAPARSGRRSLCTLAVFSVVSSCLVWPNACRAVCMTLTLARARARKQTQTRAVTRAARNPDAHL